MNWHWSITIGMTEFTGWIRDTPKAFHCNAVLAFIDVYWTGKQTLCTDFLHISISSADSTRAW